MSLRATSGVSAEEETISPKLLITMVGCILAFLVIVIGFFLVSRKKRGAPSFPAPSGPALPLAHNHHHPIRRGVATPVASPTKCPACSESKPSGKRLESARASYESLRSLTPLPLYTRYAPTGVSAIRPETWRSQAASAASPTAPTMLPCPSTPPPAYARRGPTASVRCAVY
ncbi:hypothetical protein GSI_02882 [Ganoderma sinense ZZ0214-1]|uniref:Uncharacterized protein n=1 Tax=Ganoderma sinense ZZ0214-1 TaxID=1077348 RepID=A0A2G8SMU8_9APHY|nr:hypothetical protein GSI_02882 [Ganoderma sinense ZZ0214-1]